MDSHAYRHARYTRRRAALATRGALYVAYPSERRYGAFCANQPASAPLLHARPPERTGTEQPATDAA